MPSTPYNKRADGDSLLCNIGVVHAYGYFGTL